VDLKKKLDEDFERYWLFIDFYFKKTLQNPNLKDNEFIKGQISENHKKTLLKLENLYKKAVIQIEKSKNIKEKTPKFYSEQPQSNSFNFPLMVLGSKN